MNSARHLGEPQVKMRRRTGADERVHKSDVEAHMAGKLITQKRYVLGNNPARDVSNRVSTALANLPSPTAYFTKSHTNNGE